MVDRFIWIKFYCFLQVIFCFIVLFTIKINIANAPMCNMLGSHVIFWQSQNILVSFNCFYIITFFSLLICDFKQLCNLIHKLYSHVKFLFCRLRSDSNVANFGFVWVVFWEKPTMHIVTILANLENSFFVIELDIVHFYFVLIFVYITISKGGVAKIRKENYY